MKKVLHLTVLFLSLFFLAACSFTKTAESKNFPEKTIFLPEKTGQRSLPAAGFITTSGKFASLPTEVYLQRTADGIQIEFRCFWDKNNAEWTEKTPDDQTAFFGAEHVEFQIAPKGIKDGIYYHFGINPAGSVYHARCRDTGWTPEGFIYRTEIMDDHWSVIAQLPYSALGYSDTPEKHENWNINFCRTIRKKNSVSEDTSWTGSPNFHDISFMGNLLFSGTAPEQNLLIYHCKLNAEGKLSIDAAQTSGKKGMIQIYDQGKIIANFSMSGSDRKEYICNLKDNYINLKGIREISIYYFNELRTPAQFFRGTVKTNEKDFLLPDKMEYIKADSMKCNVADFPGKLVIRNDEKILREQNVEKQEDSVISLKDLPSGRYIVEYSCNGQRSSRVFFIAPDPLREPEAFPENAILTAKGKDLFLNGEPYYLFGLSEGDKKQLPVNPGYSYSYGPGARKNAVAVQGFPIGNLTYKPSVGRIFAKNWEELTRKHLERSGKSKRPLWRRIAYEANLTVFQPDENGSLIPVPDGHNMYGKVYQISKEIIPDGIFVLHVDNISVVKHYAPFCDALEYATWNSCYHPENMMLHFRHDLEEIQKIAGEKPVVAWLGGSIPNPVCRSAEEIRAGVYCTILHGGAGNTIHMGHSGIAPERTRFWSMLSMIQREIDSFYKDLKTWNKADMRFPENTIGQAVISPEGELLVVLLNTTLTELKTTLNLPEPFGKKDLILTPLEPRVLRFAPEEKK